MSKTMHFYTIGELAKKVSRNPMTVRRYAHNGLIQPVATAGPTRVPLYTQGAFLTLQLKLEGINGRARKVVRQPRKRRTK